MKGTEKPFGWLLVAGLVLVACGGSASPEPLAAPAPTEEVAASTVDVPAETSTPADPVPEATATEVPVVEISDVDRVAAAIAALERDGTGDLVAWDVLESRVNDQGDVILTLCGWTGDTVFDDVYQSTWKLDDAESPPATAELNTFKIDGECLNTELIESALATLEEFANFWTDTIADPASFESDPRAARLLTPGTYDSALQAATERIESDLSVRGVALSSALNDLQAPVLFRRFATEDDQRLEFVLCHQMGEYGTYRGEVLIDDRKPEDVGPHEINAVVLLASPDDAVWRVATRAGLVWADCDAAEDWALGSSQWRPESVDFEVLAR
jgi:hypothetical protein